MPKSPIKIYLATTNVHKITEISDLVSKVLDCQIIAQNVAVLESGATFEENARLKASALADILKNDGRDESDGDYLIFADDSGLCVDALNGAPGIFSARFHTVFTQENVPDQNLISNSKTCDAKNRAALFGALKSKGIKQGRAHFVSSICVMGRVDSKIYGFCQSGRLDGWVHDSELGDGGFGYDSMFSLKKDGKRIAQLSFDEKQALSHRTKALKATIDVLKQNL